MRSCRLLLQVPMIMNKGLQTHYDITATLENFLRHQKSSPVTRKTVTFGTISTLKVLWKGMKRKKSPSAYVFVNKNGVTCHATMPFASASAHDHEEVFANSLWHHNYSRKFFTAPKVITSHSQNSNFYTLPEHF